MSVRHESGGDLFASGCEALVAPVNCLGVHGKGLAAIPALGCGLGGLSWEVVRPLVEQAGRRMTGCSVAVYGPRGSS